VHPLVTLLETLDALSRRYGRETIEADAFVRHYEDAARIVRALDRLPPSVISARTLADDMLAQKDVAALPSAYDPSLVLDDPAKRAAVEQAYDRIAPMFWGPRIPLDEACGTGWRRCGGEPPRQSGSIDTPRHEAAVGRLTLALQPDHRMSGARAVRDRVTPPPSQIGPTWAVPANSGWNRIDACFRVSSRQSCPQAFQKTCGQTGPSGFNKKEGADLHPPPLLILQTPGRGPMAPLSYLPGSTSA
jgi:hypothetical protein